MNDLDIDMPRGRGLFEVSRANGERLVTNVRRLAGDERPSGSALIARRPWLLGLLAAGLVRGCLAAQYRYVFAARHQSLAERRSRRSLLDLLHDRVHAAGARPVPWPASPARTERALILVCAVASAGHERRRRRHRLARAAWSPTWCAPVVPRRGRRPGRGRDPAARPRLTTRRSAWTALGRCAGRRCAARRPGPAVLAAVHPGRPLDDGQGLRRMVLDAAPLPGCRPCRRRRRSTRRRPRRPRCWRCTGSTPTTATGRWPAKVAAELAPQARPAGGHRPGLRVRRA